MEQFMTQMSYSTNEVARVAGDLRTTLNNALDHVGRLPVPINPLGVTASRGLSVCSLQIRTLIAERRRRDDFFAADLFADPAWDMLLELYATNLEQQRISVTKLCKSAAVPPTTALRWISTLEEHEYICKQNDRLDGRRVFVSLSVQGKAMMDAYFQQETQGI